MVPWIKWRKPTGSETLWHARRSDQPNKSCCGVKIPATVLEEVESRPFGDPVCDLCVATVRKFKHNYESKTVNAKSRVLQVK